MADQSTNEKEHRPTSIICIGMAGAGKTTFMQRLNSHLHSKKDPPYVINLDPAVLKVPFGTNIDIRDSVDYKKVMDQYGLGPNGAIMTSLNLFSTKIDQVLNIVEKRSSKVNNIIIDTPGQIECFIWSASGAIITDALASSFPTVIAYIVDTPRSSSPATFMSNMLYACSILYKMKLPMIIVFNKTDAKDATFAKEWMSDFEAFQKVLSEDPEVNGEGETSSGYMGSLMNSLSLMLEEFYKHLDVVSVSAYTGDGFDDFLDAVENKTQEYERDYKAERDRLIEERKAESTKRKTEDLTRLMKDIGVNDDLEKPTEPANALSDFEDDESGDEETRGILDPEYFEPTREHSYGDELQDRENASDGKGIQERYQEALNESRKETEKLESIMSKMK